MPWPAPGAPMWCPAGAAADMLFDWFALDVVVSMAACAQRIYVTEGCLCNLPNQLPVQLPVASDVCLCTG